MMTEDQVGCENSIFPNLSMTFTTKRIISHSVSLLARSWWYWIGKRAPGTGACASGRSRDSRRDHYASLRSYTVEWTTLQNYRETGNLLFSRGKHARGTRLLDALLSVRIVRVGKANRCKSRLERNISLRDRNFIFQIIVSINHPTSLSNFFFHLCCNIGKIGEMKFCIKIGTNPCKIMFRCSWNLKIEKFF